MKKLSAVLLSIAYLASIYLGVWAVDRFGIVSILGTGIMAPAAVYVVGLTLVLRDLLQDAAGKAVTIALIVVGAILSYQINPGLAFASGAAFLIAELLDFAIYTPIRKRFGRISGILTSNAISIPIDSIIFLTLAFGSLDFFWGQVIGKAAATILAIALLAPVVLLRRARAS